MTSTNPDKHTTPETASPASMDRPTSDTASTPDSTRNASAEQQDSSRSKSRQWVATGARILLIVIVTVCFLTWSFYIDLRQYATKPMRPGIIAPITLDVYKGQDLHTISLALFQAELIRIPWKFRLLGRLRKFDRKIKHGEYQLSPQMSPMQIYEHLVSGRVVLHKITIPEGYNYQQIAEVVSQQGFDSVENFTEAVTDPQLILKYGIQADSLEGYLFPDTYHFPKNATARNILHTMLQKFEEVTTDEWRTRCEAMGMSIHEAVTLASIIEKETAAAGERPLISSVFHNRLKRGMRLETDPTVIYGMADFDGDLTRKDLRTPTPYNTYVIKGLPPGPISNPGAKALHAALHPQETDYIFFVSKNNGTHHFSATLKEHNRAVHQYQILSRRK